MVGHQYFNIIYCRLCPLARVRARWEQPMGRRLKNESQSFIKRNCLDSCKVNSGQDFRHQTKLPTLLNFQAYPASFQVRHFLSFSLLKTVLLLAIIMRSLMFNDKHECANETIPLTFRPSWRPFPTSTTVRSPTCHGRLSTRVQSIATKCFGGSV